MAMVHCRECGKKISETASSCPSCGARQSESHHESGRRSGHSHLKHVTPFAAWGIIIFFVGFIWTLLTWFNFCEQTRRVDKKYELKSWAWFVPIYVNFYLREVNETLNQLIEDKRLKNVNKLENSTFLNLFIPFVPLYRIFQRWNDIVDELQK